MHLIRNWCNHPTELANATGDEFLIPPAKLPALEREEFQSERDWKEAESARVREEERLNAIINQINDNTLKFRLTTDGRKELIRRYRAVQAVRGQKGTGAPFEKGATMKCACWYFFTKYCSSWIFLDIFPEPVYGVIVQCFAVLKKFCAYTVTTELLDELQVEIVESLTEASMVLPPCKQVLWFHYLLHCVPQVQTWGPFWSVSMFRIERRMGVFAKSVKQRPTPELSTQ